MLNVSETKSTKRYITLFFVHNTKQYTSVKALRGHNIRRRYTTTQGRDELRKNDDSDNETMSGKVHRCTAARLLPRYGRRRQARRHTAGAEDGVTECDLISSTSPCDDTRNWTRKTHKQTNGSIQT